MILQFKNDYIYLVWLILIFYFVLNVNAGNLAVKASTLEMSMALSTAKFFSRLCY